MAEMICIVCPKGCRLQVEETGGHTVTGNACKRGEVYGKKELINPTRPVTSTVRILGAAIPRLPVKTEGEIPKKEVMRAVALLDEVCLQAPVEMGQVVLADVLGSGVNFVATRTLPLDEWA